MKTPSFVGLRPKSRKSSAIAQASSRKTETRCEKSLRKLLWQLGLRYRVNVKNLPGKPDIVFPKEKVAVFVDGDFWHGRNLAQRLRRLESGHNSTYWVNKIKRNVERDRENTSQLINGGWHVIRVWESDVQKSGNMISKTILATIRGGA